MPTFKPYTRPSLLPIAGGAMNAPTSPAGNTGTLADSNMLVDLTLRRKAFAKHDKSVTAEVARNHNSSSDMGRYTKQLLPPKALSEVISVDNKITIFHRSRTLPWFDSGARVLSSAAYYDYTQTMRAFTDEREEAVIKFVQNYPSFYQDAKLLLNGLFNPDEYPPAHKIKSFFTMEYTIFPFPQSKDLRIPELRPQLDAAINRALQQAAQDIVGRMQTVVGRMVERLNAYNIDNDGKVEGKFHDTLVGNIEDLISLIPILNIAHDPTITQYAKDMVDLIKHDPQELRDNEHLRKETATRAQSILDAMSQFV